MVAKHATIRTKWMKVSCCQRSLCLIAGAVCQLPLRQSQAKPVDAWLSQLVLSALLRCTGSWPYPASVPRVVCPDQGEEHTAGRHSSSVPSGPNASCALLLALLHVPWTQAQHKGSCGPAMCAVLHDDSGSCRDALILPHRSIKFALLYNCTSLTACCSVCECTLYACWPRSESDRPQDHNQCDNAQLQDNTEVEYTCRCSMLEIYNESVYDLLNASGEDLDLHLRPRSEEVYVKGLSWEEVKTGKQLALLMWTMLHSSKWTSYNTCLRRSTDFACSQLNLARPAQKLSVPLSIRATCCLLLCHPCFHLDNSRCCVSQMKRQSRCHCS